MVKFLHDNSRQIPHLRWKLTPSKYLLYPRSTGVGVCCFTSVLPSVRPKIFFVAFFSATIDGRNLILGHNLHIDTPYRGKRFLTRQIPTSCFPTYLVFIHIYHTGPLWHLHRHTMDRYLQQICRQEI